MGRVEPEGRSRSSHAQIVVVIPLSALAKERHERMPAGHVHCFGRAKRARRDHHIVEAGAGGVGPGQVELRRKLIILGMKTHHHGDHEDEEEGAEGDLDEQVWRVSLGCSLEVPGLTNRSRCCFVSLVADPILPPYSRGVVDHWVRSNTIRTKNEQRDGEDAPEERPDLVGLWPSAPAPALPHRSS